MSNQPATDYMLATSVPDVIARAASMWPDAEAVVVDEQRLTYSALLEGAEVRAREFLCAGVERGEHVGIHLPASVEFYELLFGALLAGAVVVPLNYRFRGDELAYVIEDSDCVVVVTSNRFAPELDLVARLRESIGELDPSALGGSGHRALREVIVEDDQESAAPLPVESALLKDLEQELQRRRSGIRLGDPALLFYTSGTTARPKGVHQSHEAISRGSRETSRRWKMRAEDSLLCPLPNFHMGGVLPLVHSAWVGSKFVAMPYFDVDQAIDLMDRERVSVLFTAFPKLTSDIYEHPRFADLDVSRVRLISNAAPPELLIRTDQAFPDGAVITPYGSTEAGWCCTIGDVDEPLELRLTSGRPLPGVEIRVVDPETEVPLAAEVNGELQIRSFAVMTGYHKDTEKSAEALNDDGWLRTGDLGHLLSSGHVRFIARIKETMKVGGENVAPLEIESLLLTHDEVQSAQVAGIPDPKFGEVPAAWVELSAGSELTEQDLLAFCEDRIARFKVPRHLRIVTEWPMSATKVQKSVLVDSLIAELAEPSPSPVD